MEKILRLKIKEKNFFNLCLRKVLLIIPILKAFYMSMIYRQRFLVIPSKNPGTPFITGTISIATDDAMTNIVPVHFTYVTATFGSGKPLMILTQLS